MHLKRMKLSLLTTALVQVFAAIPLAHGENLCQTLPTENQYLASGFVWRDTDHVFFKDTNGEHGSAIFTPRSNWYEYQPSTSRLQISTSPYDDLETLPDPIVRHRAEIQPGPYGLYELVGLSPSQHFAVYPRLNIYETAGYVLRNLEDQTLIDLDIPHDHPNLPFNAVWSADETRLILQGENFPNSVLPTRLITLKDGQPVVQLLADVAPLDGYGDNFKASGFFVMGISPDGNTIIMQPETVDYLMWSVDLAAKKITTLDFSMRGRPSVSWLDETTFAAVTDKGVIAYNLADQTTTILASPESIDLSTLNYAQLSPDGTWLTGERLGENNSHSIEICRIKLYP